MHFLTEGVITHGKCPHSCDTRQKQKSGASKSKFEKEIQPKNSNFLIFFGLEMRKIIKLANLDYLLLTDHEFNTIALKKSINSCPNIKS